MNIPILSIIVPSYNTAKFVSECVPYFISDDLFDLCHVYFIDDGATDNTKEELDYFLKRYPNYFSFIHKENGGHGSVINFGIENVVKTKYFRIIDGDDYVETGNLVKLCRFLTQTDHDLIIDDYTRVFPNESVLTHSLINKERPDLLSSYILNLTNMTFKTSIFKQNGIKVRECVFYEDNEYVLFPLPFIHSFQYLPLDIYRYRLGSQDQSVSIQSRLKKRNDSALINEDLMKQYIYLSKDETVFSDVVLCYMMRLSSFLTNEYILDLFSLKTSKEIKAHFFKREQILKKMPKLRSYMTKSNKKYKLLNLCHFKHLKLLKFIFRFKLRGDLF